MKNKYFNRSIFLIYLLLASFLLSSYSSAQWIPTNGPNGGGKVYAIASSDSIILASNIDGVSISTNNGESWKIINDGLPGPSPNGLPSGPFCFSIKGNYIFAGVNFWNVDYIYLTTNYGANWILKSNGFHLTSTTCMTIIGNDVLVGGYGVYKSTDNGESWNLILSPGSIVKGFVLKDNLLYVGADHGFYYSSDHGSSWTHSYLPPYSTLFSITGSGNSILIGTWDTSENKRIFRTINNGYNWTSVYQSNLYVLTLVSNGLNIYGSTEWYNGPNVIGIIHSTNGGSSWSNVETGITGFHNPCLNIKGNNVYFGYTDGIYKSTDDGTSWTLKNSGLMHQSVKCVKLKGTDIYAGSTISTGGLFKTTNSGNNWENVNTGLSDKVITDLEVSENNLFLTTTTSDNIYRSTDNGTSWNLKNSGIVNESVYCIKSFNNKLFAGTGAGSNCKIYSTSNSGENWSPNVSIPITDHITCLSVTDSSIYAGTSSHGIYYSIIKDGSFVPINNGLTNLAVNCIINNNSNLYAGTNNGIFISTNNGNSWSMTSHLIGYPNEKVYTMSSDGNYIIAGSDNGLYVSTNNGAHWAAKNEGFHVNSAYMSVRINCMMTYNNFLYAGISNQSVWKRSYDELTGIQINSNNIPAEFSLLQNYPNPFNPSTKIKFAIPLNSFVSLKIYNSIGREVGELVNVNLTAGSYEYEFNGENLASGIYFYMLETEKFSETRKMILMK